MLRATRIPVVVTRVCVVSFFLDQPVSSLMRIVSHVRATPPRLGAVVDSPLVCRKRLRTLCVGIF
jgi:hypothetical protein